MTEGEQMSLQIGKCERNNLCVDCDYKKCVFAGELIADCPLYVCNRSGEQYEDCESCELLKQLHAERRRANARNNRRT